MDKVKSSSISGEEFSWNWFTAAGRSMDHITIPSHWDNFLCGKVTNDNLFRVPFNEPVSNVRGYEGGIVYAGTDSNSQSEHNLATLSSSLPVKDKVSILAVTVLQNKTVCCLTS